MAILVVGTICDMRQNGSDPAKYDAHIIFQATDGAIRTVNGDMWVNSIDPNALSADIKSQCETAMKTEAVNQLGVTFGVLDGTRLLSGIL